MMKVLDRINEHVNSGMLLTYTSSSDKEKKRIRKEVAHMLWREANYTGPFRLVVKEWKTGGINWSSTKLVVDCNKTAFLKGAHKKK